MNRPSMKDIIDTIPVEILEKELTEDKFIRETNYGANHIYIVSHNDSPNILKEIGRLREITFREAGGGTGKPYDLDELDTGPNQYRQLIVWSPEDKILIGGYRFMYCPPIAEKNVWAESIATNKLFKFSEEFINDYLPYSIELGRSFVQPLLQSRHLMKKGIYSLDNLWDGLGSLIVDNPNIKYFFGKVTMYKHYNAIARDLLLYFFSKHFPDKDKLLLPYNPLKIQLQTEELKSIFTGNSYKEDYKILSYNIRKYNEKIPPLINTYMNTSPSMKVFGTADNHSFGGVEETGILITIDEIFDDKKNRHVNTYKPCS